MLRASARQKVISPLEDSYFGVENFTIEFGAGDPNWVLIQFIPRPDFFYRISRRPSESYPYDTLAAPGVQLLSPDADFVKTFEDCLVDIPSWISRIKEEVIDQNPIARELQNVRKQLNARIEELAGDQETFFTREEAEELKANLGEFLARLNVLSNSNNELSSLVANLQIKIAELQAATEEVNKGTWLRMAGSKLLTAAKSVMRSKEAREFALEAAKKVLLEGS